MAYKQIQLMHGGHSAWSANSIDISDKKRFLSPPSLSWHRMAKPARPSGDEIFWNDASLFSFRAEYISVLFHFPIIDCWIKRVRCSSSSRWISFSAVSLIGPLKPLPLSHSSTPICLSSGSFWITAWENIVNEQSLRLKNRKISMMIASYKHRKKKEQRIHIKEASFCDFDNSGFTNPSHISFGSVSSFQWVMCCSQAYNNCWLRCRM